MNLVKRKCATAINMVLNNPQQLVIALGQYGLFNLLPDALYLKFAYRVEMRKALNLNNPVIFSEKIQWLKIHDRPNKYTQLVDKYTVRAFVKEQFGEELLIPLIGVYEHAENIEWHRLPEKFVIKCTHGSGCNIVCRDKKELQKNAAVAQLNAWMKKNWYYFGREWPYRGVQPRIIIEEFVSDNDSSADLTDYKMYCFEGIPLYCQVIGGRHIENGHNLYFIDFYDMDWNKMPFTGMNAPSKPYPHFPTERKQPCAFRRMVDVAKSLAANTHFVRIDFYEIDGQPKFGEFTLYPLSGFGEFEPEEWNRTLGDLIKLPTDCNAEDK